MGFETERYYEEARRPDSRIAYIPINSQSRQITRHQIHLTHAELHDFTVIKLDELSMHNINDLFRLEKEEIVSYERKDNTWLSVTIEMNLNVKVLERNTYTFFDFSSDIGGYISINAILFAYIS